MIRCLMVLLLAGGLAAADLTYEASDFSLGLNTVKTDRAMRPRSPEDPMVEARVCHDVDLNRYPGAITIRKGYEWLFTIAGQDSFVWNGVFTAQWLDGSKELLLVSDSEGVGYGNIYRSERNTIDFGSRDSVFMWIDSAEVFNIVDSLGSDDSLWLWIGMTYGGTTYRSDTLVCETSTFATWAALLDSLAALVQASPCSTVVSADTVHGDSTLVMIEAAADMAVTYSGYIYFHHSSWGWYPLINPFYGVDWSVWTGGFVTPDRVATMVGVTGQVGFEQYDDRVFIRNSAGRGLVYDGRGCGWFPSQGSGDVVAVPLNTAGPIEGRRRYCLRPAEDTLLNTGDSTILGGLGYLSLSVTVDSGQVLLRDFPRRTFTRRYGGPDSITYEIWATTADVGKLDKLDTVWNSGLTVVVDSSNYETVTVVDNVSDDSLRLSSGVVFVDGLLRAFETTTSDSVGLNLASGNYTYYNRPGMPQMYDWGSLSGSNGIWGTGAGEGDSVAVSWLACAGFSVMVVAIDTSLDIPADSGVSLNLLQYQTPLAYEADTTALGYANGISRENTERLKYILPRLGDTSLVMLVYRAPILAIKYDSLSSMWYGGKWNPMVYGREFDIQHYYLIGQYNQGDTVTDTVSYAVLTSERTDYVRNAVPTGIKGMAVVGSRLVLTDGNYVSWSDPSDTVLSLLTLDRLPIQPDDGDEGTALWVSTQGLLRAPKNKSMLDMYEIEGGFSSPQLSAHYGCVSGFSHVAAPEGDYFLSHDGVRLEDEGAYKERSVIGSLMSGAIKSFTEQPLTTLKRSVGAYYDRKYMLSFPSIDTTFVLHKIATDEGAYRYSWATWSLTFSGSTMYRVSSENELIPGDSLYFIRPGESSLYRFGSSETDNGTAIRMVYETGPMGPMDGSEYQIYDVGVWAKSSDTVDGGLTARFYNDEYHAGRWGRYFEGESIAFERLDTRRFQLREVPSVSTAMYWSVCLRSTDLYDGTINAVIDGLRLRIGPEEQPRLR